MFLVFNKDKLVSFFVAACTVGILFMMASFFTGVPAETVETVNPKRQFKEEEFNPDNNVENEVNVIEE